MQRRVSRLLRVGGGAAILGLLVWRLGTGPFLAGLRTVSLGPVLVAAAITAATTSCCAWRWRLVAGRLGVELSLGRAVAAYYRSQFLNTALPGGVLGDVHRGLRHGQEAGDLGRGLRAVAWERAAGQVVQMLATVAVLVALPSPARPALAWGLGGIAAALALGAVVVRLAPTAGPSRVARMLRTAGTDVRDGLLARAAWPGVLGTSLLAAAGHAAVFLVAARVAGVPASLAVLLPLTMLVLVSAAIPANVGGWGPREGVAAWAFAAAGLGADAGIRAATVFGVLVFAASLPGAVVLAITWRRRPAGRPAPANPPARGPVRAPRPRPARPAGIATPG